MKVAFVYDRVNKIGGAERVLTSLHQIWPKAPIFTAVYQPKKATWAQSINIIPSFLNRIPLIRSHHEWFASLMPYAFESFDLSAYDVIISVTSAEAKGILTGPHQLHLCYLLTPTRYLWSHRSDYQGKGLISHIRQPFMNSLAAWDKVAAMRPDKIIAISQAVSKRCLNYYHRQPDAVIYPPVETNKFAKHPANCLHPKPGYFIIVSRLVSYKRVDLAIKACNQTGDRLIVVGIGSNLTKLKRLAKANIHFAGQVTDEQLACLYQHAEGLIFPQEEEFGIVALEAQAAGLPVVAFNAGSAKEIIVANQTGLLFNHQTTSSLVQAMTALKSHTWYDKTIRLHAQKFDQKLFKRQFSQYLEAEWTKHQSE